MNPAGNGNYLLSAGSEMSLGIRIEPTWNQNEGYTKGTKLALVLPWFYYDENNILVQTFDREALLKEKPDVQFIGGVEAKLDTTSSTWYTPAPSDPNDWGSDYDYENNSGSYRREQLDIVSMETLEFKTTQTFNVTFKFFTIDNNAIPENTSASIMLRVKTVVI